MAASVIICGVRGPNGVDLAELRQMGGRAGRSEKDKDAVVHVIAERECMGDLADFSTVPSVISAFGEVRSLKFHLLSKIANGRVKTVEDAVNWYSRSLAAKQEIKVDFRGVFGELERDSAVIKLGSDSYLITDFGRIALDNYFGIEDIVAWKDNFEFVFSNGDEEKSEAIAWAVSTGRVSAFDLLSSGGSIVVEGFPSIYRADGNRIFEEVLWYSAFEDIPLRGVSIQKASLRENSGRIGNALRQLNHVANWNMEKYFERVCLMLSKGISFGVSVYFDVPSMTKQKALELMERNASLEESIAELSSC